MSDSDDTAMTTQIAASSPSIREVHEYWHRKAGQRRMPSRGDIDPAELKRYLPRITLVDVVPDARHLVYRLTGTREVEQRGTDPTGKPVKDAYFGPSSDEVMRRYDYVIQHRAPYYFRGGFDMGEKFVDREEILFLPLSENGDDVNMIMVFVQPDEEYAKPAA